MSASPLRIAIVMDPPEDEDFGASTTIAFMLEAQKRGHELFYLDPADLGVSQGEATAWASRVVLQQSSLTRDEPQRIVLDRDVDVVLQRKDPPVDDEYVTATQILGTCGHALVLNRPASIIAYNEKLFALHFRELMPDTAVTRRIADLHAFMQAMGGEMIVKPLDGKGGEGIFHLAPGERNLTSVLEQVTAFESRRVMAQRYLPAVREGDKRILLLEGEPLGAVLRVPSESEVRANFHVGGRAAKAEFEDADRRIIARLGPVLKREGLFFVGIDVIGGQLTEVNVTSPTGVQEINSLDGVCLEAQVMDRIEQRAAERLRATS